MGDKMELRNINTFVRVAELLNFSKAAAELGYSQSTATIQIKQLEDELGKQLFERIGKHIRLTETGANFLPKAIEILKAVREARKVVLSEGEVTGKLRIGTVDSLLSSFLPQVIVDFRKRCPKVEVSTYTSRVKELFDMLRRNEIDILYFLDVKTDFPEWIKVMERPEKTVFVTTADNPLSREKNISIERLIQEPFLLTEKGGSYRYIMEQMLASHRMEINPFLETSNTDLILRMLLKDGGVSFLPKYVIEDYIENGSLVILDVQCPEITVWSQLIYHKNKLLTPQMEEFIEVLKEKYEN